MTGETTVGLKPHQQRVVDERDELNERIRKLHDFRTTADYNRVGIAERQRLTYQVVVMELYSAILRDRIAAFRG